METADLSPTEWLEKFILFSKEESELSKKSFYNKIEKLMEQKDTTTCDEYHFDKNNKIIIKLSTKKALEYDSRMMRMRPLLLGKPRLEKICKDWRNDFLDTGYTRYSFYKNENDSVNELQEKVNDLKYLLNLCGSSLINIDVREYPISEMMPIINANCPNLKSFFIKFEEIMDQDFENVFSNMSHLKNLTIEWECKNSTLPMTLAKSLVQIGGTLNRLYLSCSFRENDIFSPDSLVCVFPRLTVLKHLAISGFGLSQLLLQSIGEMKNLSWLDLTPYWTENHPMFDTRIDMYPIGNLKTLNRLWIQFDYGVNDEFLINLCNNAKKLMYLSLIGKDLTDSGIKAINNLEELVSFDLGLTWDPLQKKINEYITDESIQCLYNEKLEFLNISNCIQITDKSLLNIMENLPSLDFLVIKNTKVTRNAVEKLYKIARNRIKLFAVSENIEKDN